MVSAGVAVGEGREADAAGPRQPARHALDGPSSPGVGIHGTPEDGSIGYSLSHGCIRMHIPQAEWLFDHVDVGHAGVYRRGLDARAQAHGPGRRARGRRGPAGLLVWQLTHQDARAPKIGGPRAGFSLQPLDAPAKLDLASLRGKPVVLNFWASWCVPCKGEATMLEQAWQQYREQGVVVRRRRLPRRDERRAQRSSRITA